MKLFKVLLLVAMFVTIVFFIGINSVRAAEIELSGKELKAKTVTEVATIYKIDSIEFAKEISNAIGVKVNLNDTFQLLADNYGAETSTIKEIAAKLQETSGQTLTAKDAAATTEATVAKTVAPVKQYNFYPIFFGLLFAYIASFLLSRFKVISYTLHKEIWNWLLLGFFLVSAVLGSLLVLRISNGVVVPMPFNMLYWHVEAGLALTAISIFHIIWHWRYFVIVFKKKL